MKQEYQTTSGTNAGRRGSLTAQFAERYAMWSAPMRFLLGLGLVLILYFGVIEPAYQGAKTFGGAADELADKMALIGRDSGRDRQRILSARERWGPRTIPARGQGSTDLQKAINKVLETHGVTVGVTIKDIGTDELKGGTRGGGTRRRGAEKAAADPRTLILSQTKTQVQFSAAPDVVIAVLADLEKNPTVACIQRVSLSRKVSRDILSVTFVAQSWQLK